ncbi:hypothetical protein [Planotetraspora kaengkrachanensis]|uniref:Uncharacterized protein n=1 Tax=Planotetraspora kaengkrachanensis TaxID=575193 RepID=A0A8J3PU22_9ACTN|nr:hypothetical protein [Planotetraspora kaengkrachanensis]GIG81049.1 hypothetical protein Pka01_41760 [Planotetraspora kaengkrachanensis]
MNPHDVQSSLDDIRRFQDTTRKEIVRQRFARPYVLLAALGLFIGLASIDLQSPWRTATLLLGFGLFAGVGIVQEHRAVVHRKPAGPEWLFWGGMSAGLMLLFGIFRIAAWAWFALPAQGLSSQGTLAAAATAATYVALTPLARRILQKITRRDGARV